MTAAPTTAPVLELTGASFGYAGGGTTRAVVTHVDLTVRAGEVVAVLGPNGSGKSTLVRGILGLNDHLGGQVRLFGVPEEKFTDRHRIGYVPQRHSLSGSVRATVREVVSTGRLPHRRWWRLPSAADAAAVDHALDLVGLADRSREDVATLSGGQQRRVLIARALAAEPEVLLMDEPTAGVDAASQGALVGVLARLADRGTTMVVVTHELEPLASVVTRVVCTRDGGIDFDGSLSAYRSGHGHPGEPHGHHHDHDSREGDTAVSARPPDGPLDSLRDAMRAGQGEGRG